MRQSIKWYWILLLASALLLRLVALNATLLTPDEARLALPAWEASQGQAWPASTSSPLLLTGSTLLFLLFGAGDGIARVLPALTGSVLACTPYLWRRKTGEHSAYSAAGLLLLSPIALFAARRLDGTVVGITGAVLVITALYLSNAEEAPRHVSYLWAAGTALGLTGGASFYDALIPGILAWGIYRWLDTEEKPFNTASLKNGLAIGIAGAFLISIGLGFRWNGWSGPAEGLQSWLSGWGSINVASYAKGLLVFLYEPLTLLLAGVGISSAIKKNDPLYLSFIVWAWAAWILPILRPAAGPMAQLAPVIPLAMLAGWGLKETLGSLSNWRWTGEKLHAFLSLIFWIFAGLALARQTTYLKSGMELVLVALIVIIQGLMVAGFATLAHRKSAWRGLLLGTAAACLLIQVSFGWGASYLRAGNPAEPLVTTASSADLRNLREMLDTLRTAQGISPEAFKVALISDASDTTAAAAWALRDLPGLERDTRWAADPGTQVILAPESSVPPENSAAADGMKFTTVLRPNTTAVLACNTEIFPPICDRPLKWYFYRQNPAAPYTEQIILWKLPETP